MRCGLELLLPARSQCRLRPGPTVDGSRAGPTAGALGSACAAVRLPPPPPLPCAVRPHLLRASRSVPQCPPGLRRTADCGGSPAAPRTRCSAAAGWPPRAGRSCRQARRSGGTSCRARPAPTPMPVRTSPAGPAAAPGHRRPQTSRPPRAPRHSRRCRSSSGLASGGYAERARRTCPTAPLPRRKSA